MLGKTKQYPEPPFHNKEWVYKENLCEAVWKSAIIYSEKVLDDPRSLKLEDIELRHKQGLVQLGKVPSIGSIATSPYQD